MGKMSDQRLKTDVERIATHGKTGVGIYKFRYHVDPPGTVRVGVLAQELQKVLPDAVTETEGGWLSVDYSQL